MSELRSAVDGYRAEVLADLPDARIEEDFEELQRAADLLEMERLRRLAEIDRRQVWARDGHLSAASWLVSAHRRGWTSARADVKATRALEEMPETRRAAGEGEISAPAARLLAWARDADPEAFRDAEEVLVDAARRHRMGDLRRIAAHWRQRVELALGMGSDERLREQRRLHASVTFLGMVRVDGDLDPEGGETVLTALRAVMDAEVKGGETDGRTAAQRRADALTEICREWLDAAGRPAVCGERPHVTVTPGGASLASGGDAAEMDHVGPVAPAVARRLACDASIRRVVMAGRSDPLDVGRRTPVVPPALRRAVIVRDRHCRFPGCDRPHTWCDAHHVRHWADGGPTSIANLLLLCRRHHRMVHDRFGLAVEDGRAVFRRPDGSVLDERAPP